MLLKDKMKDYPFSPSEQTIINYILERQENIKNESTQTIAKNTYTSPSTLIRISKKLGYKGWNDFKESFLYEIAYLNQHFQDIDPNYPFTSQDSIMTIANKLTQLHVESAHDTLSLLQHDSLQKAVKILNASQEVKIFAVANLNYIGEEFAFKLHRIGKKVYICPTQDNMFQDAAMTTKDDCAICISYSGETPTLLKTVSYLQKNKVPIVAITSVGENSLSHIASATLHMTTRERSFSKIAGFSSLESISLILDILYSCLFALHYQKNLDYKLNIAHMIETNRHIDNEIIEEKDI